jgi:hypothetical protein
MCLDGVFLRSGNVVHNSDSILFMKIEEIRKESSEDDNDQLNGNRKAALLRNSRLKQKKRLFIIIVYKLTFSNV